MKNRINKRKIIKEVGCFSMKMKKNLKKMSRENQRKK